MIYAGVDVARKNIKSIIDNKGGIHEVTLVN